MKQLIHIPYEKISEDLDNYSLTEKDYRLIRKQKWVVTEKIHGAHLCIHTDGNIIACAKRKEILKPGDDFFHYEMLKQTLEQKILHLYSLVKQDVPGMIQLSVHGELFGGEYPHPDVTPVSGVQAIQTGVYYCPDIRFCTFDMAVISRENTKTYIDFHTFTEYAKKVSLFSSQALFIGSFHDAMIYDISFESTIAPLLGLPSLGPGNRAEGVVIKPGKPFLLDIRGKKIRPVIKRKIPEFSEDKRFHQAQKWNKWMQKSTTFKAENGTQLMLSTGQTGKKHTASSKEQILVNETFVKQEIDPLVTSQRLANAISKTGRLCKKNKARILRALIEDIIESLAARFKESYHRLAEVDKKKIYTIVKMKCKELIKNA